LGVDHLFDSNEVKGETVKVDGIQLAFAGNCVGTGFNKPEGLCAFVSSRLKSPVKHVVFIDDVADHCLNVYEYFKASYERDRSSVPFQRLTVLWWPVSVPPEFLPKEQTSQAIDRFEQLWKQQQKAETK
jgi:hypothetical protein